MMITVAVAPRNPRTANEYAAAARSRVREPDASSWAMRKTLTSLAIMLAYRETEWPLLILCPASLRYAWPAEIEKFCQFIPSQSIYCVRGTNDVHFATEICKWRDKRKHVSHDDGAKCSMRCPIQVVVFTYSLLQTRYQTAKALMDCNFECIIADESHNLKQISSQRCRLALPLLHRSRRLVLLSGTPALNRPVELWPQLHALDARGTMFGNGGMRYGEYTRRYCNARRTRFGYDVSGSSNADELHMCLRKVMIRRLKSDVLHDLPSKQRSIVPVSILDKDKERESRHTINRLNMARQAVSKITDLDADDVANSARWEARKLLMQAYQASGIAKAPSTTEYILDWLEGTDSTQKLVVFAHHKEVLDYIETSIATKYKGRLGMMRIDGSVSPAERALRVKKFQTSDKIRLSLLSMTAAGVGLTLTAASNIIFAELHWTPGILAQCEDRCHRIGQASSVNVMYCICKDEEVSCDMSLWSMLARKVGNLGKVVDGERGQLDAVERENDASSDGEKSQSRARNCKGTSVEDELMSFFASSTIATCGKQTKGPIVKGTIQSFFMKQTKKCGSSKDAPVVYEAGEASTRNVAACISLLEEIEDEPEYNCTPRSIDKDNAPSHSCSLQKSILQSSQTDSRPPSSRLRLALPWPEATHSTEKLVPISSSWSCTVCTYNNRGDTTICQICNTTKSFDLTTKRCMIGADTNGSGAESSLKVNGIEGDEEWSETDLVAIDVVTQSHGEAIQSRSSDPQPDDSTSSYLLDTPADMLSFAVSLNSGRIALYLSSTGQPLSVNFDIAQVLTKTSADALEDFHLLRNVSNSIIPHSQHNISFDDGAVRQVLAAVVDDTLILSREESLHVMCEELKQFVRCYLSLREVEKKAVKESGRAFTASSLKRSLVKLLPSTITGTTERYQGGAKERAIENMNNGCATAIDMSVINGQACVWCAKPFRFTNGAVYCTQFCAEAGRVRRGGMYSSTKIREQLFALEHGKCTKVRRIYLVILLGSLVLFMSFFHVDNNAWFLSKCNIDAHELFCKIKVLQPAERLNMLLRAKWKLPKTRLATDRLLMNPQEHDFWQADHIFAVAEGGGSSGLDNLRTLCTPCHSAETEKLLARLKTLPCSSSVRAKYDQTQMDIFSAFSNMRNHKLVDENESGKRRRLAD
ncbi:hypothetical protein ACHAXA_001464 [Cyclostephanos tholiformis]|uniref:DNA annealing helicase and endonuclease ZRANB3 n=1 Tax=Cyclostephanos tholiformis TaxID=382380 RepID=A0ABD3RZ36_9STRA